MHAEVIAIFFHPGDLSLEEWASLVGMFIGFIILPIVIIGFVIVKVVKRHSSRAGSECQESITLGLNDPTRK